MINPMKRFLFHPAAVLAAFSLFLFAPAVSAAEADEHESHSILEVILDGGPALITVWIFILITSIVMVTFIIQLFLAVRKDVFAPKELYESLHNAISAGNYQEAWEISRANKNYLAAVLMAALERLGRGKEAVEVALIEHGQRESQPIKTKNSYLSVIGVIAPMLGLLATVIGMMGAFAVLGTAGVTDPRALSMRIGEVLVATASGLFIGIPGFVFFYYFRGRLTNVLVDADDKLNRLVEDIPFEELSGIRIGDTFEAGAGAPAAGAGESRKVSMALTTNCPVCNGAIQAGQNPCPHCGATLDWN